jgi:vacuolar-type H+-ATPase subunit E/Vma4
MSAATRAPRRFRFGSSAGDAQFAALRTALEPVAAALLAAAQARVDAVLTDAENDAAIELDRARAEAKRIIVTARAEGRELAERVAALELADARREASGLVLAAHRRAFATLRMRAIEALIAEADTPSGRELGEWIVEAVRRRVGAEATVTRVGLSVEAASGNRRAILGPTELIDAALESLAVDVEALWA